MDSLQRLKELSIEQMVELRDAIDAGLRERIAAERRTLEGKLAILEAAETGSPKQKRGVAKGTKV